jgi:hypothetical protein
LYDKKVNEAVSLLKQDPDRDVKHIVQEILSYQQGIVDSDSESSKDSHNFERTQNDSIDGGVDKFIDSLQ